MSDRDIFPSSQGDGLVGRDPERRMLEDRATRSLAGHTEVVVVRGPSGIGKSSLVADARARWTATQLHTTCREETQRSSYHVVRGIFAPLGLTGDDADASSLTSGQASWALPALIPGTPEPGGYQVLHGLYWLTVNVLSRGPLMFIVDDAHWCDEASLRWLQFLLRRMDEAALLVILVQRTGSDGPAARLLSEIVSQQRCTLVDVGPLAESAVSEIISRASGADPDRDFVRECVTISGGNPMVLTRLVSELRERGLWPERGTAPRVAEVGRDVVTSSVLARLAQQPDHVRRVATATAVLGEEDEELVGSLAEVSTDQTARARNILQSIDILAVHRPGFVHDVVREVVLEAMAPTERERLRARAAWLLTESGRPSGEVAHQLLHLSELDRPWMVDALRHAAAVAEQQGSPSASVRYLERVLDTKDLVSDRISVRVDLARALTEIDPLAALSRLEDILADVSDPRCRAEIALQHTATAFAASRLDRAVGVLADALDRWRADTSTSFTSSDEELYELLTSALLLTGSTQTSTLIRVRDRARAMPVPEGITASERRVLAAMAATAAMESQPATRVLDLCRRAVGPGTTDWEANASVLISALQLADDVTTAEELLERALKSTWQRGDAWTYHALVAGRSLLRYAVGEVAEAAADAQTAVEISEQAPWTQLNALPFGAHAMALVEQARLDQAEAMLDRCDPASIGDYTWRWPLIVRTRARLRYRYGDPEGALALLWECRRADEAGVANPVFLPWRADAALVLAELGRRGEALELVEQHAELSRRWGTTRAVGGSLEAEGLVAGGKRGVDLLTEAVEMLDKSPARLAHAWAEYRLGRTLLETDRVTDARKRLHRAGDLAGQCGSRLLGTLARDLLVTAGGRPRWPAESAVDRLTGSERRVATLAASGASNREIAETLFVTPRTVETHLTSVYRKLGVTARSGLPDLLSGRQG